MTPDRLVRGATDRPRSTVAGRVARGILLLPLATWSLVGCYAYLPAATVPGGDAAMAGRTVRVALTADGTRLVQPLLGTNVVEVNGVVAKAGPDSLWLAVREVATGPRERFPSTGTQVALPRTAMASVEVQQLSRRRTTLLAAAAGAVLVVVASAWSGSFGGSGSGDPGPSPQPQRLPPR